MQQWRCISSECFVSVIEGSTQRLGIYIHIARYIQLVFFDDDQEEFDSPPPEDGFDVQDELASDTPRDPSDGFEVEKIIESRLGDEPFETPEEGFETEHEEKAPEPDVPLPSEGFDEERET